MANAIDGQLCTCACGSVGGIVDMPHPLDVKAKWFVVRHENGEEHRIECFDDEEGTWRFKMKES